MATCIGLTLLLRTQAADHEVEQPSEAHAVVGAFGREEDAHEQVGLAWLLAHAEQTLLIPGTRSVAHLEENLAAGEVVPDEDVADSL